MSAILECRNVSKRYGRVEAVRQLDMTLEENTIYGLLGRNGAGKTSLLNMVTGGLFPDSGEIKIAGMRLKRGETPKDICFVRDKNFFFGGAKVNEILEVAAAFHPNWDWDYAHRLIQVFNVDPNKKIRQLTRGMESIVGNIVGMASRAPLTIFDEPVLGLDVLMREKFYRLLVEDYANYPRTILLSTHLIDEIAKVVERVCIMEAGSILLHDDVDNIRIQSFMCQGKKEAIQAFTGGKRVIYQEVFGNGAIAAVYNTMGEADLVEADKLGITVDGLPLQKFFAYLLEGGQEQ
ncbi:ABC transporter ATP-binding protein [Paenibacillus sp. DXFW5]|uniref:ABC transporter ATP-binding protein n=1 Tax=Paenibacillus rhizolycopersici TaxID=2780073 RepID=A0ABS2H1V1_9BACL|nr:ABC transporter ATP-binding protein [Paenibacillus rhizolycopersici]MBM6994728.1 ABC transporter ATP-binding protein [Paenibacillus rhizolycopersici]